MCFRSPIFWVYFPHCLSPKQIVFPKHTSGHASSLPKFHPWRPIACGIKARPYIICLLPGLPKATSASQAGTCHSLTQQACRVLPPRECTHCPASLECCLCPLPVHPVDSAHKQLATPSCTVLFFCSHFLELFATIAPACHPGTLGEILALCFSTMRTLWIGA